jgi:hypothetical protein
MHLHTVFPHIHINTYTHTNTHTYTPKTRCSNLSFERMWLSVWLWLSLSIYLSISSSPSQEYPPEWLPEFPTVEAALFWAMLMGLLDVSMELTTSKCTRKVLGTPLFRSVWFSFLKLMLCMLCKTSRFSYYLFLVCLTLQVDRGRRLLCRFACCIFWVLLIQVVAHTRTHTDCKRKKNT